MKPLNSQERTTGLLKFAGLFTITLILVLFAVYFDFSPVPKSEVENYKNQVASLRATVKVDSSLLSTFKKLNTDIVTFQNDPSNPIASNDVVKGVSTFGDIAQNDSVSYAGKFSRQIQLLSTFAVNAIKKVAGSGNAADDLKKAKDDLKTCQDDLKEKNQTILTLQGQLSLYQNKK